MKNRLNSSRVTARAIGALLGFTILLNAQPVAAQTSILPKTPNEPDKVIVLDYSQATAPLATLTCLQGVINRYEANKASGERRFIFIKNLPSTRFSNRAPETWDSLLADGLVPYTLEEPTLSGSGMLLLDYMMANFSQAVKGYVISPTDSSRVTAAVRAAALNVCSLEGSISQGWPLMVSTATHNYLVGEGYNKSVVANLEAMNLTDLQAFDWSVNRGHLTDPDRNDQISAFLGGYEMIMADYFVMTGTFAWYLEKVGSASSPTDAEADFRILQQLLPTYAPGAVHAGPTEGGHVIQHIQNSSQLGVTGWISNISVMSAVPTTPSQFTRPIPPQALDIDPSGVYLAWRSNDGDAWDVADYFIYEQYEDPIADALPAGRTETAYILDMFPSLISWLSSTRNGEVEITASLNDGGYPTSEVGKDAYYDIYKYYFSQANGVFTSMHYLGGSNPKHAQVMSDFQLPYVYMGYQGDETPTVYELLDNTVYSNQTLERDRSVADSITDIRNIIVNADPNKPVFLMLRENTLISDIAATYQGVISDPAVIATGRTIYRTLPSDVAATWRSEYESRKEPLWTEDFETSTAFSNSTRVVKPNIEGAKGDWVGRVVSQAGGYVTAISPSNGDFPIALPADALRCRIEAWMAINGPEQGDLRLQLRIRFQDGSGTANSTAANYFFREKVSDQFLKIGRDVEIPAGATAIDRIELRVIQSQSGSTPQDVYFDDVTLYAERETPVTGLVNGVLDRVLEAEDYDRDGDGEGPGVQSGIQAISGPEYSGGAKLTNGSVNAWVRYTNVDFGIGVEGVEITASNDSGSSRSVEFRVGSVDGDLLSAITVPATNGWDEITSASNSSLKLVGVRDLYLVMPDGRVDVDTLTLRSDGSDLNNDTPDLGEQIEAEDFDYGSGVGIYPGGTGGKIGNVQAGDYVRYDGFDFGIGAKSFDIALSSNTNGGTVEVRLGSLTGELVGTASIGGTGSWNAFQVVSVNLTREVTGVEDLYLVFTGGGGSLVDVDWFKFKAEAIPGIGQDLDVRVEAENYDAHQGVGIYPGGTGQKIGNIQSGDWVQYANFDFGTGASGYEIELSSNTTGGTVEFRLDSVTGQLIGSVTQTGTGNWNSFVTRGENFAVQPDGVHDLYLVFVGGSGSLVDVDWFEIQSGGSASTALFDEDFEGTIGFTNTTAVDVSGNGVGELTVPTSGNVTAKDNFGGSSGAIALSGETQLSLQAGLQLPSAEQGSVAVRMVVRFNSSTGGTIDVNANYLDLDASAVGNFVNYSESITVPANAVSIADVRVRVNQNTSGSASQALYLDDVLVEGN